MFIKRYYNHIFLIILSIILYIPLFLRNSNIPFIGVDSYYYINYIFHQTELHVSTFVQEFIFSLFPANLFVIKFIMLITTIACVLIFFETVEVIKKNRGFIASCFFLSFFWWSWIFIKLENDLFGLLFVLISLYFLIRYVFLDKSKVFFNKNIILSLFFLFIGVLIWNFAVYFLIAFLFISQYHRLYVIACLFLIPFFHRFITGLLSNINISENQPIKGFVVLMFLAFLYFKEIRLNETWIAVLIFTGLTFVNAKLLYITVPLLLLSFVNVNINNNKRIKKAILFLIILFFGITIYQNIITFPTDSDYELLTIAHLKEIELNKELYVTWSLGYFAIWSGYPAIHYGTIPSEYIPYENKLILTLNKDKKIENCKVLKKSRYLTLADC